MLAHLLKRLGTMVPVLLVASAIVFFMGRMAPGDPVEILLGEQRATPEMIRATREHYGLDRPLVVQYAVWLKNMVRGDLGMSYFQPDRAVAEIISEGFPVTAGLGLLAMGLAVTAGVTLGVLAAWKVGTWLDSLALLAAMIGVSIPRFVLAPILTLVFALQLHLLPVAGWGGWEYHVLPALVLSANAGAIICRMTRSSLLDVLSRDYIRTAWSKGLSERSVVLVHGLKNALIPVLTVAGTNFGFLLVGSFITETIFNIPGLGRQGVEAIFQRDYPVIQGVVLTMMATFTAVNLLVDMLYGLADPRVTLE